MTESVHIVLIDVKERGLSNGGWLTVIAKVYLPADILL